MISALALFHQYVYANTGFMFPACVACSYLTYAMSLANKFTMPSCTVYRSIPI